ncbi:MAG: lamin tail domain-containing protein [Candidatus Poribacteria bacterium]|nr:lamin tail domain-containing protein [Candidatus Poribacteria bacterium]
MFPHKPISVLTLLTVTLVLCLCSQWSAMAQFSEQRLIPLVVQASADSNSDNKYAPATSDVSRRENPVGIDIGPLYLIENADTVNLPAHDFAVYGRAPRGYPTTTTTNPDPDTYDGAGSAEAGILVHVPYEHIRHSMLQEPNSTRMPDLETFFDFGGTLELVTAEDSSLAMRDIVISEIMWAVDRGIDNSPDGGGIMVPNPNYDRSLPVDQNTNPETITIRVPQLQNQEVQWIELYNTTNAAITETLYFLFTPFVSHPTRDTVTFGGTTYKVLDSIDTLFAGLWKLPGKSGDRPNTAFVSAYRAIDYNTVEDGDLDRAAQLAGIPFGANPNSWQATPANGRRNTDIKIIAGNAVIELLSISTPGAKHVTGIHVGRLQQSAVNSDIIVINEVRNDTSNANIDWVELKNVSSGMQQLKDWELSIVTAAGTDTDLVDLPEYEIDSGEILLLVNEDPWVTPLAAGANAANMDEQQRAGAMAYVVDSRLNLPNTGKFMLLLRNNPNKNGKDENIQDYAGNGFFEDFSANVSTQFWPRVGQYKSAASSIAAFGDNTFASRDQAWQRKRYQANDGHHKDAWEAVGPKGGLGYDPNADLSTSPGTPGYERAALKSATDRLVDGEISISEIMYDRGLNGSTPQWIEIYNSSLTEAVNLNGWELQIRNLHDAEGRYIDGTIKFKDITVLPNQTVLVVARNATTNLPDGRVYNIYVNHRRDLNMSRLDLLLNPMGFYLKLTDKGNPNLQGDDMVIDEVGNIAARGARTVEWALPETGGEQRRSIVRLYGIAFRPEENGFDGEPDPPEDGLMAEAWILFSKDGPSPNYYGARDDLANPGYRKGGPVPVELASFRPVRTENGAVLIKWRTESELNNAGFNILRSENRDKDFQVINIKGIIPGNGTSSEEHLYSYTDTTAKLNVVYYYRIEDVSFDGTRRMLATVRLKGEVSAADKLTTRWGDLKARD